MLLSTYSATNLLANKFESSCIIFMYILASKIDWHMFCSHVSYENQWKTFEYGACSCQVKIELYSMIIIMMIS